MIGEIFWNIIDFLKSAAPISIIFNVILGIALLVVGIVFLKKRQKTKGHKIGGWVCVSVSALAFLGAASNWVFSYVVF